MIKGLSTAAKDLATLAEQLGSRRVLAEAYFAQIRSFPAERDIVVARDLAQRALNEAEAANEPLLVQRAHDILALFAYTLGEHKVARYHATAQPGGGTAAWRINTRSVPSQPPGRGRSDGWEVG